MPRLPFFITVAMLAGASVATMHADAFSPTTGYYATTEGLSGKPLDSALHARIKDQTVRSYDQLRQDLAVTDRDWAYPAPANNPTAITNILLMYSIGWSGYSRSGVWDSGSTWNREHTWPDSRGVGQPDQGPDFSDLHHLRAANPSANTARNNRWYDAGGTLAPVTQAPLARRDTNTWEPPDVDKGWIARALLYMATRYDGAETDTTDLELVETPPVSTTSNPPQMGRKSVLLQWNRRFPPGEWERRRNQIVFERYQGNRNPFIDHPEFADAIYEQPSGVETLFTWRLRHFTPDELDNASLAGDLADPDGDGRPNLLEFALGADPRASDAALGPALQSDSVSGSVHFVYRRQRDRALAFVNYVVEYADTLAGPWQPLSGAGETFLATAGSIETVAVSAPNPGGTRFWRLHVSR